ncbi:hypothetical protein ACQX2R_07045 [Corynebacterium diphtheriae]
MAYSSDKAQQQINSYAEFVESFRQTTAKRMAEFEQELADAQKKAHEAAKEETRTPRTGIRCGRDRGVDTPAEHAWKSTGSPTESLT